MHILFVCLGNICRSPTAEGVARHLATQRGLQECLTFDSAGTANYHPGKPPDPRAREHALQRGYDLSALRARVVTIRDFDRFDLILGMDGSNLARLREVRPAGSRAEVCRFLDVLPDDEGRDVPDPYHGGAAGFEEVLDLCELALGQWIERWREQV